MGKNTKVTVEDLIDGAIVEGFQRGTAAFLDSIEEQLQIDMVLQEAECEPEDILQAMIDEAETETNFAESADELETLSNKMSRILR